MFSNDQYELLDFGDGKKLERFAGLTVMRDCPAAQLCRALKPLPDQRSLDGIGHEKASGKWRNNVDLPVPWQLRHRDAVFNLRPTPFGHLGVFCEQAENWDWLADLSLGSLNARALNLFAYTGGSTLAMAAAGAQVVHVDSAKNVVNWARENAASSELADAPIRWIVEDALKFVRREIKRGNRYDVIVVDPPAIGHAGKKMTWKFERDIAELVSGLGELVSEDFAALLFTCHTVGFDSGSIECIVDEHFDLVGGTRQAGPLDLLSVDRRRLNCGHFFRWHR